MLAAICSAVVHVPPTHTHSCTHILHTDTQTDARAHISYTHVHMHTYFTHPHAHIFQTHTYTHTHVHMHTYLTHSHTHTCTCTHTPTPPPTHTHFSGLFSEFLSSEVRGQCGIPPQAVSDRHRRSPRLPASLPVCPQPRSAPSGCLQKAFVLIPACLQREAGQLAEDTEAPA